MFEFLKTLKGSRTATASLYDLLDQSRQTVIEAKQRLKAVHQAPQDEQTSLSKFEAWIDQAATDAVDRLGLRHASEPQWGGPKLPSHPVRVGDAMARDNTAATEILLGLVALIGRDILMKTAQGQIADRLDGVEGMTASTRAKRAAEAEAAILEAELAEESIVRAMEAAGITVSRRADADARCLLADDASLPA